MRCHDLANQLLDYADARDRDGYRAERDRIRREYGSDEARDAERWVRIALNAKRNNATPGWRSTYLSQKGHQHG